MLAGSIVPSCTVVSADVLSVPVADTVTAALNNVEQPISSAIAPAINRFLIFTMLFAPFHFLVKKSRPSHKPAYRCPQPQPYIKTRSWILYSVFMYDTGCGRSLIQCIYDSFLSYKLLPAWKITRTICTTSRNKLSTNLTAKHNNFATNKRIDTKKDKILFKTAISASSLIVSKFIELSEL